MHTEETILLAVLLPWVVGMLIAMVIARVRLTSSIRDRVAATGRAVSNEFVVGYLVWNGLKALLWPLTLVLWLALGRPRRRWFTTPEAVHG